MRLQCQSGDFIYILSMHIGFVGASEKEREKEVNEK